MIFCNKDLLIYAVRTSHNIFLFANQRGRDDLNICLGKEERNSYGILIWKSIRKSLLEKTEVEVGE
jgi:hypothetical protein